MCLPEKRLWVAGMYSSTPNYAAQNCNLSKAKTCVLIKRKLWDLKSWNQSGLSVTKQWKVQAQLFSNRFKILRRKLFAQILNNFFSSRGVFFNFIFDVSDVSLHEKIFDVIGHCLNPSDEVISQMTRTAQLGVRFQVWLGVRCIRLFT